MDEKRSTIFTIILIASVILVFSAADLIYGDRLYSELENKVLASRPEFSWNALLEGDFTRDYETYLTDQFAGREKWISIKTYMDICLGKQEINGVYLGADDYLIEQHLPKQFSSVQENKKLSLLEKLVSEWNASVMLVPTADNVIMDKLPPFAVCYDQVRFLEQVESRIGPEHYIDVYTALRQHADEEIYYRTDHHWTSLGAYYGYQAWAAAQDRYGGRYHVENMETVTEDFLGTLQSKVNLNVRKDSIKYFPETMNPVSVTYDYNVVKDTYYEESWLDTKNKYGFFLDDNHAFVEIETGCPNGKTLFVIKDSFANCLIPLLTSHYERIYVLDLRYFNGRLFQFMKKYRPESGVAYKGFLM